VPKQAQELGALAVSRLTAPGLHFVGGVPGLALQVLPSGARSWLLRVLVGTKRREMGLGGYPGVTLAQAREAAALARAKIRQGIDPIEEAAKARQLLRLAQANAVTFERAASSYIEIHEPAWSNQKHAQQWRNSLSTHAYPKIGAMLVRDIETVHVMDVLEPLWRTKTETATRLRSRIEAVLDWATTKGYRDGLNPARWKGHIENLLPAPSKIAKEKHHPALAVKDASAFVQALRQLDGVGARALEFGILTAARSGEIRGATWGEIDLEAAEWTIPAERMKMKSAHRVPLAARALELLRALRVVRETGEPLPPPARGELVFKGMRGSELSDATLNAVIARMNKGESPRWVDARDGRPVVQHGFRSTFRDWVAELTNYPNEVAEMALAHTIGSKVESAYRRGDLFEKRRNMMNDWAAFLDRVALPADVIDMASRRA
jgi:integrase